MIFLSCAENKVVLDFIKFIDKDKNYLSFESFLLTKASDSALFPSNELLKHSILNQEVYDSRKSKFLSNIFLEIENLIRNSKQESITVKPESLTIEHILPQDWSEHWRIDSNYVDKKDVEIASQAKFAESEKQDFYQKVDSRNAGDHPRFCVTAL